MPELITLPSSSMTFVDIVALAAFLLEYSAAYVPTSAEQSSFLAGVPLDVYECVLVRFDAAEHVLLKFSCPVNLGETVHGLSPEVMIGRLEARFRPRLEKAGFQGTLNARHSRETHARVAL